MTRLIYLAAGLVTFGLVIATALGADDPQVYRWATGMIVWLTAAAVAAAIWATTAALWKTSRRRRAIARHPSNGGVRQ